MFKKLVSCPLLVRVNTAEDGEIEETPSTECSPDSDGSLLDSSDTLDKGKEVLQSPLYEDRMEEPAHVKKSVLARTGPDIPRSGANLAFPDLANSSSGIFPHDIKFCHSGLTCYCSFSSSELKTLSLSQLNELYLELEVLIREFSETLIAELALRDELEYEKELKNTFISLLLAVQNKRRQYHVERKRSNRGSNALRTPNGLDPKYLTTVIPYHLGSGPPDNQALQVLIKILKAINEDSPTVPTLLTDYILKGNAMSNVRKRTTSEFVGVDLPRTHSLSLTLVCIHQLVL
uniref:Fasciculation and elongation protein zeta-2 n=1 Tax=Timema monikensis TaxID=170555 RepID=A0A7R9DWJ6_9NEOP|nr:unnamed protein product [Timema monikensis]